MQALSATNAETERSRIVGFIGVGAGDGWCAAPGEEARAERRAVVPASVIVIMFFEHATT